MHLNLPTNFGGGGVGRSGHVQVGFEFSEDFLRRLRRFGRLRQTNVRQMLRKENIYFEWQ